MAIIAQVGEDCEITLGGVMRTIKVCNAAKAANTFWDKEGEKYSIEQMEAWGFVLREG